MKRPRVYVLCSVLWLIMLTVALAACGGGPAATATPVSIATERAIAQPTTPPTTIPSPPPPTATPPPPTATLLPPTATSAPTATPAIKPTEKPSATPTPAPHAIVTSETLNVRSGPDTQYDVIIRVAKGDALTVVGQTDQCNWLRILTAQNVVGWVARRSGGAELVQLNLPCAEIPAVSVPSPTPRPTVRPQPTQPPAPAQGGLPADKGCYLFQNFMGAELNVTFNNGHGWSDNFKIAPNAERLYCLAPDHYTYTIDAPPPWASISGSLDVQAGKHYRFPIQGRP